MIKQDQALWRFELRDRCRPHVRFGDELEINVIELPKADRLARKGGLAAHPGLDASALPALVAWINLFLHWQEENIMSQIDEQSVQRLIAHGMTEEVARAMLVPVEPGSKS